MDFIPTLYSRRLNQSFFTRPTLNVARDLLGKYLISSRNDNLIIGQITETEAYIGTDDLACHARFGPTPRTKIMWGEAGRLYVYLIYGLHHLVNIITENPGFPAAVLLRQVRLIPQEFKSDFLPTLNLPTLTVSKKTDKTILTPAKICSVFGLTRADTGLDITTGKEFFIADLGSKPQKIITSPRLGISYAAEPWKSLPWRFLVSN